MNVWHDRWCLVSPLSEFIDTRDIYDARLNNNCTVREIIHEGRWIWLEEWNNEFEELRKIQVPILSNENEDTALWVSRSCQEQQFKISNVWKDMNCNDTKVDWFSMVWFVQSIPRHAFVTLFRLVVVGVVVVFVVVVAVVIVVVVVVFVIVVVVVAIVVDVAIVVVVAADVVVFAGAGVVAAAIVVVAVFVVVVVFVIDDDDDDENLWVMSNPNDN
ncbi:hypothetical protein Tco_1187902 [Tanacetum coccineum]